MANEVVRCAVIGAGLLGTAHAEFLAGRRNAKLMAVADVRSEAAESLATRTGAKAYTSYGQMLASEKLDLALVETPDYLHREPAVKCCEAGVPNLVMQKPLSTSVEDGAAILSAAEASNTRLYVWYGNRANATDMATRYAIRSGLVGRVVYGDCVINDSINVPLAMWGDRSRDWTAKSSPAQFLLTHTVDRLMWYLAPARVRRVFAVAQQEVLGYTPDLYDVFLFFDNGMKARMKAGWIDHIESGVESAEVFNGHDGQIFNNRSTRFGTRRGWRVNFGGEPSFDELRQHQEELRRRGVGSRVARREPLASGWGRGTSWGLEIPTDEAPNRELLEFVLDSVMEDTLEPRSWKEWQGEGTLPTGEQALENVRILNAIEISAREGAPVDLPETSAKVPPKTAG